MWSSGIIYSNYTKLLKSDMSGYQIRREGALPCIESLEFKVVMQSPEVVL